MLRPSITPEFTGTLWGTLAIESYRYMSSISENVRLVGMLIPHVVYSSDRTAF